MVDLSVADGKLVVRVLGADKLWALKRSLEFPLQHVAGIRVDPAIVQGLWQGLRMPIKRSSSALTIGTFHQDGQRVFWDVHKLDNAVVIELRDERYNKLIVEVANPNAAVEVLNAALPPE